ncbi:DUF6236 family protein [Duganella radicis]|uniref:Uncharacterized protein n=1 Tax=Duganella radicis TaxID=551988 RepID=A0A6L6PGW4_9BURK|nr:DUF6236 family protein [Duganella radicis]MTV37535.1 hypothetical protein [Duganella radicis]
MGESKHRKQSELDYGKRPKGGRGIMLVPDFIEPRRNGGLEAHKHLSAEQLRFALLFWDRIAWPSVRFFQGDNNVETDFLMKAGVLVRPETQLAPSSMSVGRCLANAYFDVFQKLENKEPGRWSLAAETDADIRAFLGDMVVPDRGVNVSLHRAIPVPRGDAPLEDILEFKLKRDPELLALREEIDTARRLVTSSTDRAQEFATQWDRIDGACRDLLLVSREMKMPIRIADMSFGLEITGGAILAAIGAAATAYTLKETNTLVTSLASAGASCVKFAKTYGTRRNLLKKSPLRYVHHFHEDIDWQ